MLDVVIVEDDELVRTGIVEWLNDSSEINVLADVGSAEQCLSLLESTTPHVILIDVILPGISGLDLIRRIHSVSTDIHCVVLTGVPSPEMIIQGFSNGAVGFLPKQIAPEDLEVALSHISHGRKYLSPGITDSFLAYVLELQRQYDELMTSSPRDLTEQEKVFLQLLAEGLRFTEIGEKLKMTPRGVDKMKCRIEDKLGAQSLSDLIREAIRLGLINP